VEALRCSVTDGSALRDCRRLGPDVDSNCHIGLYIYIYIYIYIKHFAQSKITIKGEKNAISL
jgi:hypothetical protein